MYKIEADRQRWLRGLFFVQVAGCLLSVLALLSTIFTFAVGRWYTGMQHIVALGVAGCLLQLPGRYRLAGGLKVLTLLCGVLPGLLNRWMPIPMQAMMTVSSMLSVTSTVLMLIAMVLEYTAHGRVSSRDRNKWYILMGVSLAVTVFSALAMMIMHPIINDWAQQGAYAFIQMWNIGARAISLVMNVFYLVLLHRVQEKE